MSWSTVLDHTAGKIKSFYGGTSPAMRKAAIGAGVGALGGGAAAGDGRRGRGALLGGAAGFMIGGGPNGPAGNINMNSVKGYANQGMNYAKKGMGWARNKTGW